MAPVIYDCIVIGVGGIGSAALYHLARRGANVLGLDQYPIAHDQGSSHGDSRIIRLVYFEHPDYVPLLKRAYELWHELDAESPTPLLHQTGILQAGPAEGEVIRGLVRAAHEHELPMEVIGAKQLRNRFPGFSIPQQDTAIFDPGGGILQVEQCVQFHLRMAERHGATFRSRETVRHWYASRDKVTVETDDNRYFARKLVITPGPWAARLLPKFAPYLHLRRKSLFWFDDEDNSYSLDGGTPVFLFEQGAHTFYGFPALDSKGIKVADHSGGRRINEPADLDRHVDTTELETATLMLRQYLPRAGHQLNHHTTCMYTMSEDSHFLVGGYPGIDRVNVVAGLSGHGFKFAPVLGEVMADMTLEGQTRHPIEFLSPLRFQGLS